MAVDAPQVVGGLQTPLQTPPVVAGTPPRDAAAAGTPPVIGGTPQQSPRAGGAATSDPHAPIFPGSAPPPVVRSLHKCLFLGAPWTQQILKKRCEEQEQKTGASCGGAEGGPSFVQSLPLGSDKPILVTILPVDVGEGVVTLGEEAPSIKAHEILVSPDAERDILRVTNAQLAKISAMKSIDDVREWLYPAVNQANLDEKHGGSLL